MVLEACIPCVYMQCLLILYCFFICNENMPLKHPIPLNTSLHLLCHSHVVVFFTCHHVTFLVWTCNNVVCFLFNFIAILQINFCLFWTYLVFFSFLCLSFWPAVVVSQLMLNSCSPLQSFMFNDAGLFPSTTKVLHWNLMPLFIIVISKWLAHLHLI